MFAAGLSREEVLSKGVNVLAAFDQLVDFVHANTPPGQTPVIVGHQGFELSFKHVEQYMRRVAAAAGTSGRGGPTSSNTGLIGGSTTDLNSSSSTASTSSSSGKGRRRRVAPVAADPSTPNTSSSTSSKGYQHSSWPQDWMFLDTYVMAQVLQSLPPSHDTRGEAFTGSTLQQMLRRCLYKQRPPAGYEFEDVHMPEVDKPRDDSLGAYAGRAKPSRGPTSKNASVWTKEAAGCHNNSLSLVPCQKSSRQWGRLMQSPKQTCTNITASGKGLWLDRVCQ